MLTLFTLVAFLHLKALTYNYYWAIWWYDIMMHFLGGVLIFSALRWFDSWRNTSLARTIPRVLLVVMVVGLGWELYELYFGLTFVGDNIYLSDMIIDLVMNLVGALTAVNLYKITKLV